jgi:hypothetical protein
MTGADFANTNGGMRKIQVKGHRQGSINPVESKESQEKLVISQPENSDLRKLVPAEQTQEHHPREDRPVPKKNNLITSSPDDISKSPSMANITGKHGESPVEVTSQIMKSGELPPVKSGKVPIRRTFKPAQVKEHDFEGM